RLPAIDHEIVKQVIVPGALPHLGVHYDRAIKANHLIGRRGTGWVGVVIVRGDHVAPPGFLDVAFKLHAQGSVIPKTIEPAVYLTRLKEESPPFAEGDELVHIHGQGPRSRFTGTGPIWLTWAPGPRQSPRPRPPPAAGRGAAPVPGGTRQPRRPRGCPHHSPAAAGWPPRG